MIRLLLLGAVFLLTGCADKLPPAEPFRASDISGAQFGRDFGLVDHRGQPQRLENFRGKAVLLTFGYTHCPDICPTTLATLSAMMDKLGKEAERVQVLFVTLDPARDKPALLAGFVPFFHPRFLGLYGDEAATAATAGEFNVIYAKQDYGSAGGYSLDHSTGIYGYDPAGKLRVFIDHGSSVEDIAHDVRLLLREPQARSYI